MSAPKRRATTRSSSSVSPREEAPGHSRELPGLKDDRRADLHHAVEARKNAETGKEKSAKGVGVVESQDTSEKAPAASDEKEKKPKPRALALSGRLRQGRALLRHRPPRDNATAIDNKECWIADVSLADGKAHSLRRLTDLAGICRTSFNEFDWPRDGTAFWFTSEESDYRQLYLSRDGAIRALTTRKFDVTHVKPMYDGQWIYYRANASHPGNHEVYA